MVNSHSQWSVLVLIFIKRYIKKEKKYCTQNSAPTPTFHSTGVCSLLTVTLAPNISTIPKGPHNISFSIVNLNSLSFHITITLPLFLAICRFILIVQHKVKHENHKSFWSSQQCYFTLVQNQTRPKTYSHTLQVNIEI